MTNLDELAITNEISISDLSLHDFLVSIGYDSSIMALIDDACRNRVGVDLDPMPVLKEYTRYNRHFYYVYYADENGKIIHGTDCYTILRNKEKFTLNYAEAITSTKPMHIPDYEWEKSVMKFKELQKTVDEYIESGREYIYLSQYRTDIIAATICVIFDIYKNNDPISDGTRLRLLLKYLDEIS